MQEFDMITKADTECFGLSAVQSYEICAIEVPAAPTKVRCDVCNYYVLNYLYANNVENFHFISIPE
jgi:hypothetical protein